MSIGLIAFFHLILLTGTFISGAWTFETIKGVRYHGKAWIGISFHSYHIRL